MLTEEGHVLQPQVIAGDDDCSETEDGVENEKRRRAKRKRSRSKRRRSTGTKTEKTVEVTAHEEVRVKLEPQEGPELFDFVQARPAVPPRAVKRRRLSKTREFWTTDQRRSSTDSSVGGDTTEGGAKRPRPVIQVNVKNNEYVIWKLPKCHNRTCILSCHPTNPRTRRSAAAPFGSWRTRL